MAGRSLSLASLVVASFLALAPGAAAQRDGGTTREQAALREEQDQLYRKLVRLRTSMETLAERFDGEGRTHAATLLREGLAHLDLRGEGTASLDELMQGAQGELSGGQMLEAIRSMETAISRLERLLAILMDRPDLDELERDLEKVRELKEQLDSMARAEEELQQETEALREASRNAAQRALEEGLERALAEQRELLRRNEEAARESGALGLEALEADLEQLIRDQETDRGVLESWDPQAARDLAEAVPALESAREQEVRAARLESAAEDLRRAAAEPSAGDPRAAEEALERAAEEAQRQSRASGDESAREAAEALQQALEALRQAGSDAQARERAAAQAREQASALEAQANERRQAAAEARAAAREELQQAAGEEQQSAASDLAREVAEELARAEEEGRGREATDAALRELRAGTEEQSFLPQAVSASQAENARRARELEQQLGEMTQGETPEGQAAREALEEAAREMQEASDAAGARSPQQASSAARRAQEALERARANVSAARQASASPTGQESAEAQQLAQEQEQLAQEAERLGQEAQQGSMSPEAQRAVEEALEQAAEEMRAAAQEMSAGRRNAAASSQRRAMEQLSQAASEAREGVTPESAADRQRAQELAERQAEIEKKLYDFMQRYREREDATPLPSLEDAQQSAQQAQQSLEQGDLGQAQQQEQRAEEEIREAMAQLEEEEEQYQRLRDEELLFKIAEEVQAMRETHRGFMAETVEVDGGRSPGQAATRAMKLRLRKVSRGEEALAQRAAEVRKAIEEEESVVFAELIAQIESDLVRAARDLGDAGGYQSGDRVQTLQSDIDRQLSWLLEALEEEKDRREQENQQQGDQQDPQQDGENRLVPDVAELKLLRRMEVEVLDSLDELLALYPELSEEGAEVDPLLLDDILRMAHRHERTSDLFAQFRERLGLPDPGDEEDGRSAPPVHEEGQPEEPRAPGGE